MTTLSGYIHFKADPETIVGHINSWVKRLRLGASFVIILYKYDGLQVGYYTQTRISGCENDHLAGNKK
jgi:hypothetical protein